MFPLQKDNTMTERYTLQPVDMTDAEIIAMYLENGWPQTAHELAQQPLTRYQRRVAEQFRISTGWLPIGCETYQEYLDRLEDEAEKAEENAAYERKYYRMFFAENR